MTEHPILFSAPLVRAILAGTKTQTRRIINPQPPFYLEGQGREFRAIPGGRWGGFAVHGGAAACRSEDTIRCPFGEVGDRLWVKERHAFFDESVKEERDTSPSALFYWADHPEPLPDEGPWRPSIYMPRWASRIDLEVTGIRVERLQEIGEADAIAEGMQAGFEQERHAFAALWDKLNGQRGNWASNPWVWVISFRKLKP